PAVASRRVAGKGAVGQRGTAHIAIARAPAVEAAAYIIGKVAIGLPGGDDHAIEASAGGRAAVQPYHMVSVVALDVGRVCNHAAAVDLVIAVDVTTEHGGVGFPVAFFQLNLSAGKATIEGDTGRDVEGVAGRGAGCVDTCGD